MFKPTSKDTNSSSMPHGPNELNRIVQGAVINGDFVCETSIRVDGVLNGTVDSKAKLVLGQTGLLKGNIQCVDADIEGSVDGDMDVKEVLFLKSTAKITGDIICNKLMVEEGAVVNGKISMHQGFGKVDKEE